MKKKIPVEDSSSIFSNECFSNNMLLFGRRETQRRQYVNANDSTNNRSSQLVTPDVPCIDSESILEKQLSNVPIFGTILSHKVRLLVDTGAAIVVSEKFYYDILRNSFRLKKSETIESIKTAHGNTSPVSGLVSFRVTLGKEIYSCNASIVPKLAYTVVLGRDFLHDNCAVIDVKGQTVTFDNNER